MTTHEGPRGTVSDVLAERIEALRERRGLSTRGLAARCAAAGAPALTHEVLYNIKTGRRDATGRRRRDVTVDEFMALAAALDVAPVHLLAGLADDAPTPVTPARSEPGSTVRAWVAGSEPLPGMNAPLFWSEAPEAATGAAVGGMPLSSTVADLQHTVAELKRYVDLVEPTSIPPEESFGAPTAREEGENG